MNVPAMSVWQGFLLSLKQYMTIEVRTKQQQEEKKKEINALVYERA